MNHIHMLSCIMDHLKKSNTTLYDFFNRNPKIYKEYKKAKIPLHEAIPSTISYHLIPLLSAQSPDSPALVVLQCPPPGVYTNAHEFAQLGKDIIDLSYSISPSAKRIKVFSDNGIQFSLAFGFSPELRYFMHDTVREYNMVVSFRVYINMPGKRLGHILIKNFCPKDAYLGPVETVQEGIDTLNNYDKNNPL